MTNDDFKALFSADELAELADAAETAQYEAGLAGKINGATPAPAAPQKDGLWFDSNQDNENGHTISIYKLVMGGKVVLWARVNTALTVTADEEPAVAALPAGCTAHRIEIRDAKSAQAIPTNGFAVMAPHGDGTGTHIDGQTVRSYVLPRLPRLLGQLYGV